MITAVQLIQEAHRRAHCRTCRYTRRQARSFYNGVYYSSLCRRTFLLYAFHNSILRIYASSKERVRKNICSPKDSESYTNIPDTHAPYGGSKHFVSLKQRMEDFHFLVYCAFKGSDRHFVKPQVISSLRAGLSIPMNRKRKKHAISNLVHGKCADSPARLTAGRLFIPPTPNIQDRNNKSVELYFLKLQNGMEI